MVEIEKKIKCRFCGSDKIIKHGKRFGKKKIIQTYLCKNCNKKFSFGTKYHFSLDIVEDALVYLLNHSLRETAAYINQTYDVSIHHETIHRWRKEFLEKGTVLNKELNPNIKQTFTFVEMLQKRESRLVKRVMEFEQRLDDIEKNQKRMIDKIVNYWSELKRPEKEPIKEEKGFFKNLFR